MRRSPLRVLSLLAVVAMVLVSCVVGSYVMSLRSTSDVLLNAAALDCTTGDEPVEKVPFTIDARRLPGEDGEDVAFDEPVVPGFQLELAERTRKRCVLSLNVTNQGSRTVTVASVDAAMWAPGDLSGWPLQADEESVGRVYAGELETSEESTDARFVLDEVVAAESSTTVQIPFVQRPDVCLDADGVGSTSLKARLESWWWTTTRTIDVTVAVTSRDGLGDC